MSLDALNRNNKTEIRSLTLWVPVGLAILLVFISQFNFLLFHTLAEFFAIIVAVLLSVVAWQMYAFTRNNYLMYLGCGYFWIGVLDLLHTFSYKGVGIYELDGANTSTQFWIATRFLEALLLLTAPWFLNNRLAHKKVFIFYGVISATIIYAVLSNKFPTTYIEGQGLTAFKVNSEYLIIMVLGVAAYYLWNKRVFLETRTVRLMLAALFLTMGAELAFTFYVGVYDISNLTGHIFKFFSYWLIFIVMVKNTLQDPFTAMSRGAHTYDAVPDATVLVGTNGIIYQANQAACYLANKTQSQLIGANNHQVFHASDIAEDDCPVCKKIVSGRKMQGHEMEVDEKWLDYSLSPVTNDAEVTAMVEVMRDVSRRKQVEQALDDVNELKNSIVENLPAMLFVKTADDQRYVEWNKAAEELTGLKREDVLGRSDFDFFTETEATFYTSMDKKVLNQGVLIDIPEETIHTRDKGVRLLHTRKIPIYNKQGEASFLLGISQDITDKKATEEMLRRSQKMEAVGQLSGGIAHDFNNQLGIVTGYLEFLKEYVKDAEKQRGWVENASKAAHRCVDLTKQLLIFSRTKSADAKITDANEVIHQLEDMLAKSVTSEVQIDYALEKGLWPITVNAGDFEDAIVNMVINSRDAMPAGGTLKIRTSNVYLDSEFVIANPTIKEGHFMMLEIEDNGTGMDSEMLEHIFEPFYTTKPVGKGTGLGMSMVYAFVERNEGVIKVESKSGEGTRIKIYIPRSVQSYKREISHEEKFIADVKGGNETVLIVDDEPDLLCLASEYAESMGYSVLQAGSVQQALDLLKQNNVDLVFSDIVMPGGMNGFELAEKVTEINPQIKVLLTSGFAGKANDEAHQHYYSNNMLAKPYTRSDLGVAIRTSLDAAAAEQ